MKKQEENYQSENVKLESPSQLPDIACWQLSFVMQERHINGQRYLVITSEGIEIWKEFAYWEYYGSFLRIGRILHRKYGERVMDFVPDVDWISIYGDSISAAGIVHDFRMKIRKVYNKIEEIKDEERQEREKKQAAHQKKYKDEERRKNPKSFLDRCLNKFYK